MTSPNRVSREIFRSALRRAGLTQRGAARALGINERTVRRYAAGEPVPKLVWIALHALGMEVEKALETR